MALTNAQKVDVRRYCGYPLYGGIATSLQSYRFFQAYGTMEYRMNNMAAEEETVVGTMLTNLNTLEAAIPASGSNLDTDQAAVWTHNKDEVKDRAALFDLWRRRLCDFFGVPPGPNFGSGSTIKLVV